VIHLHSLTVFQEKNSKSYALTPGNNISKTDGYIDTATTADSISVKPVDGDTLTLSDIISVTPVDNSTVTHSDSKSNIP
jgi:hypothetical protein